MVIHHQVSFIYQCIYIKFDFHEHIIFTLTRLIILASKNLIECLEPSLRFLVYFYSIINLWQSHLIFTTRMYSSQVFSPHY